MVGMDEDISYLSFLMFKAIKWISDIDRIKLDPRKGVAVFQNYLL